MSEMPDVAGWPDFAVRNVRIISEGIEAHRRRDALKVLLEQEKQATGSLIVPVSPHAPRIASLEADVARLTAENTALAALVRELGEKNRKLMECNTQLWAKAFPQPKAEPAAAFPARALAGRKPSIGLTTELP
jgi:hypothetical protein